jgi:hypothetical protein
MGSGHFVIAVLAVVSLTFPSAMPSASSVTRPGGELGPAVRRTVKSLSKGDLSLFAGMASTRGLEVVTTEIVRKPDHASFGADDTDPLAGYTETTTWQVRVATFTRAELATPKFKRVFRRFARLLRESIGGFPTSISYSVNLPGIRERRWLGPAADGKVAAGEMWIIYFIKEGVEWKVWRLEYTFH